MDGFSVGLNLASVCGQGVLQLAFVGRLAGRPQPVWCYLFYPALLCSLGLWLNLWPAVGEPLLGLNPLSARRLVLAPASLYPLACGPPLYGR